MLKLTSRNPHPLLFREGHGPHTDMWIGSAIDNQMLTHRFIFAVSPLLLQVLGDIPGSKEPSLIFPDFSERAIDHLLTFLRYGFVDTNGEEDHLALLKLLQLLDIDHENKFNVIIGVEEAYSEDDTGMGEDLIKQEMTENSEYIYEESEEKYAEFANNNEMDNIPPVIMYSCQQCERCFSSPEHLNKHVKQKHKQGNLQCDQCPYITSNKVHFKRHVDTIHKKLLKFQCDLCSRKFRDASEMEKHKNAVHYKLKGFICDTCGEAFAWQYQLGAHVRTHSGEKPFFCGQCAIAFASSADLKRHEKQTHNVEV